MVTTTTFTSIAAGAIGAGALSVDDAAGAAAADVSPASARAAKTSEVSVARAENRARHA
jgi:hypothetical protein